MERKTETLTLEKLIGAKGALNELSALRLRMKFSYEISKFLGMINTPISTYFKAKEKFYQDNGEFNKDAGGFQLTDGKVMKRFATEDTELLAEEIEVEYPIFTLAELEEAIIPIRDKNDKPIPIGLIPATLTNIDFMIIDDEKVGDAG